MVAILKKWWPRLANIPLGKWLFSKLIGFLIPYTGSISPKVMDLGEGFATVKIRDRRRVRNHLKSVHALALSNLGEFTTGLAVHFAMKPNQRAILTRLDTTYLKKARGYITANARISDHVSLSEGPHTVRAHLRNDRDEVVAQVDATWLIGN